MTRSCLVRLALSAAMCAAFVVAAAPLVHQRAAAATPSSIASSTSDQPAAHSFKGKILSQNGERYILRDDVNDVWYHLDDQQDAAKYLGKNVLVTGVLDGFTDTIRVHSITESKS